MRHLPPASCAQFPATANYSSKDKPNLTASTSASSMISTNCSTPSASSSPPDLPKREQNPRYRPHNGLRFFADQAAKKWPLRGSLKSSARCL